MTQKLFSMFVASLIALPLMTSSMVEKAEAKLAFGCSVSVVGVGKAGGGPDISYNVKRKRALRRAHSQWRQKVRKTIGRSYTRWPYAKNRTKHCEGAAGSVYCEIQARPCKRIFTLKMR